MTRKQRTPYPTYRPMPVSGADVDKCDEMVANGISRDTYEHFQRCRTCQAVFFID